MDRDSRSRGREGADRGRRIPHRLDGLTAAQEIERSGRGYFIHTKNCGTELAQIQHVRRLLEDVGWIALVEENREAPVPRRRGESYPVGYGLYARLKSGGLGFSPAARFRTNPGGRAGRVQPAIRRTDDDGIRPPHRDDLSPQRQGSSRSRPGPMGGPPAQRGRTPARRGGGGDSIGEHRGGEGTPSSLHPAPSRRTGRAVPAGGGIRKRRLPEDERGPESLLHGSGAESAARLANAGTGSGNGRAVHPPCRFQNANCPPGRPVSLGRVCSPGTSASWGAPPITSRRRSPWTAATGRRDWSTPASVQGLAAGALPKRPSRRFSAPTPATPRPSRGWHSCGPGLSSPLDDAPRPALDRGGAAVSALEGGIGNPTRGQEMQLDISFPAGDRTEVV